MKQQISLYLDEADIEWLEDQVRNGNFKNLSRAVNECIKTVREHDWILKFHKIP